MKTVFVLCCLLLLPGAGLAQNPSEPRPLSADEMNAVGRKNTFAGQSWRLRRSSKTYRKSDGALTDHFDETTEYLPSGDSRSVIWSSTSQNPSMRTEIIRIGTKIYNLNPDGSWRESAAQGAYKLAPPAGTTSIETTAEHFYLGRTSLDGRTVELYESRLKSKATRGGKDFLTTVVIKKWVAPDGPVLRIEETFDSDAVTQQRVFAYELDPNIKIEAPMK